MKVKYTLGLSCAVVAVLGACSTPPQRFESLENARTVVPQLEASERAGVAAVNLSSARKSLDTANRMADSGGKRADIEYQSEMALMNAQIAQEKISAAEARQRIEGASADRQKVLIQARDGEIQKSEQRSKVATEQASEHTSEGRN